MEWPLLAGVPAEEVSQLLSIAPRRRFAKGDVDFLGTHPFEELTGAARRTGEQAALAEAVEYLLAPLAVSG